MPDIASFAMEIATRSPSRKNSPPSVRTTDMKNFTVNHQPGAPKMAHYTCSRPRLMDTADLPLFPGFGNRWVQPIRKARPFPFWAVAYIGGGTDGGMSMPDGAFPGLPPGMKLPPGVAMPGGAMSGMPPGMALQNMGKFANPMLPMAG